MADSPALLWESTPTGLLAGPIHKTAHGKHTGELICVSGFKRSMLVVLKDELHTSLFSSYRGQ